MRYALLMLAACAGSRPKLEVEVLQELEPPIATFRWALDPIECHDRDMRSSVDTCLSRGDGISDQFMVAAYAPLSPADPKVAVIRYNGPVIGAPLEWQQHVDLGVDPHSAVVTVVHETAIVAAISQAECRIVAIEAGTGRILGTKTITAQGARAVQLEGVNDYVRIHVRTRDGAAVAVMNPVSTRILASRTIDEHAIPEGEIIQVTPTAEQLEDVELAWDKQRLYVRRGTAWKHLLRAVKNQAELPLHRASLVLAGDRVIVTLHDPEDARVEVAAFDRVNGAPLWQSRLTGDSRRAFDNGIVRAELDGDQVIVYGSSKSFACSIGLVDGVERACVDRHVADLRVFDFNDEIVTP